MGIGKGTTQNLMQKLLETEIISLVIVTEKSLVKVSVYMVKVVRHTTLIAV